MTSAASFVLFTALGFGTLFFMNFTSGLMDSLLVRFAAVMFVSAGFIGASGWIGNVMHTTVTAVTSAVDNTSVAAFGAVVMYVVWFLLGVFWLGCLLPGRWFSQDFRDWLSVTGLVLPAGLATVPGPAGNFMMSVMSTLADVVTAPIRAMFGG